MSPPYGPGPPAPGPAPKSGTWRIVVGVGVSLFAAAYVIRGVSLLVLSIARPEVADEGAAFALGYTLPPLVLLAVGVYLIWRGSTLNGERRRRPFGPL